MSNGYGPNFKKNKKGRWYNKKTGRFTNIKKMKGARTMKSKYGGTITSWERRLSTHYTEMRKWEFGDRFTEPILEYE